MGFRKRKQERRLKAQADMENAEREQRREFRKQKKEFIKDNRRRNGIHSDSEEEGEEEGREMTEYQADDVGSVVTTVVAPLEIGTFKGLKRRSGGGDKGEDKDEEGTNDESGKPEEQASANKTQAAPAFSVATGKLRPAKKIRKFGKRRVSYTHSMSKSFRRKAKIKRKREAFKS